MSEHVMMTRTNPQAYSLFQNLVFSWGLSMSRQLLFELLGELSALIKTFYHFRGYIFPWGNSTDFTVEADGYLQSFWNVPWGEFIREPVVNKSVLLILVQRKSQEFYMSFYSCNSGPGNSYGRHFTFPGA